MIYFDGAATNKPNNYIEQIIHNYCNDGWFNPSSIYLPAKKVKKTLDKCRENIAKNINAESNEIIFTSGGCEGNSLAICGFVKACKNNNIVPVVVTTPIEHKSILLAAESCKKQALIYYVKVDKYGSVDLYHLVSILKRFEMMNEYTNNNKKYCVLVSIQWANNEIGTVQDIYYISKFVHRYKAFLHTDAVQIFGQQNIDVKKFNIDMMTVSGHKIGTPKGIGYLYKSKSFDMLEPIIYGTQEFGFRGGTENVPYIEILDYCIDNLPQKNRLDTICYYRDIIISELEKLGCILNGSKYYRLPNNINVSLPLPTTGEAFIYQMDLVNCYLSSGSACNSQSIETSYVLKSIGLSKDLASRTVRISLPNDVNEKNVNDFISEFKKQFENIKIFNSIECESNVVSQ